MLTYIEELAQAQAIGIPEQIEAAENALGIRGNTQLDFHTRVDLLETAMLRFPEFLIDLVNAAVHHLGNGIYIRELTIPQGTLLTGRIHKTDHMCVVSKGKITVWTEGKGAEVIIAPATFTSAKGARRVGYAHEETVWSTVHATTETNLDKLEEMFLEPGKEHIQIDDYHAGDAMLEHVLSGIAEEQKCLERG